jgi:hypothetical protein
VLEPERMTELVDAGEIDDCFAQQRIADRFRRQSGRAPSRPAG